MIYSTNKNNCNRHTRIDTYKNKLLFFFFSLLIPLRMGMAFYVVQQLKRKEENAEKYRLVGEIRHG